MRETILHSRYAHADLENRGGNRWKLQKASSSSPTEHIYCSIATSAKTAATATETTSPAPQNGRAVGSLDVIHALQTIDSRSKALQEMLHHLQCLSFAVLKKGKRSINPGARGPQLQISSSQVAQPLAPLLQSIFWWVVHVVLLLSPDVRNP